MHGHLNLVKLTMHLMEHTEVCGEEMEDHLKNLSELDLLHKEIFMVILMNVNVMTLNLIGFQRYKR